MSKIRIVLPLAGLLSAVACTSPSPELHAPAAPTGNLHSPATINGQAYPPPDSPYFRPALIMNPLYPAKAVHAHVEGFVDFAFTIAPDGSVRDVSIVREVPEGYGFAKEAFAVFVHWKFPPHIVDGSPVDTPAHYRMSFKLAK